MALVRRARRGRPRQRPQAGAAGRRRRPAVPAPAGPGSTRPGRLPGPTQRRHPPPATRCSPPVGGGGAEQAGPRLGGAGRPRSGRRRWRGRDDRQPLDAPAGVPDQGEMSVFAALFVFAAAVERLLEPFTRWMPGRTEQERYERAVADMENGVPGATNAAAHYKAAVDSARASRGVLMWGIATGAGDAALPGRRLLPAAHAVGQPELGRRPALGRRPGDRPRRRQRHQAPARHRQPLPAPSTPRRRRL